MSQFDSTSSTEQPAENDQADKALAGVAALFEPACNGHAVQQFTLADFYIKATKLLPEDQREAITWLENAAKLGDDGASHALEQLSIRGIDPADTGRATPHGWWYLAAAYWMQRAANQGLAVAQRELGWMYEHGLGVPRNYVAAYMWYNLAGVTIEDARSSCMLLKINRFASFDQVAEAQRLTCEFVPTSEESESE